MLSQSVINDFQPIHGVRTGIDRVALGYPLSNTMTTDYQTFFHLKSEIYSSIQNHKIKQYAKPGHSSVVGQYFDEAGKRRILTIVVGTVWGHPYAQFVFNPNRLTTADWVTIQLILCTCFNNGLKDLLEFGVIRKLELSLDFVGIPASKLVAIASRIRSVPVDYKGTKYSGKRTSPASMACYDKTKQLADVEKITLGHDMTRVEARLVKPAQTLLDIAEGKLSNPWVNNFVLSPQSLKKVCAKFFADGAKKATQITQLGLVSVLSGLSPADRKDFRRLLSVYGIATYDPNKFWSAQVDMIRRFFPKYGGKSYSV